METHFPTVPLDEVPKDSSKKGDGELRPLVMVVDDEPVITNTMAAILNHYGLATITAYDGKTALELAAAIPPDLLIADLGILGMNGLELGKAVLKLDPHCEVILSTGQYGKVASLEEARLAGSDFTVLTKPVHPSILLSSVSERLRARGWNVSAGAKAPTTPGLQPSLENSTNGERPRPASCREFAGRGLQESH